MSRIRAAAIIIDHGHILLIYRSRRGKAYWVFPGGGVESGETAEQAVVREVREETSCVVDVSKLLYRETFPDGGENHYYLCGYISGEPRLDLGAIEQTVMAQDADQVYAPQWVPLETLPSLTLYPTEIQSLVAQGILSDFAHEPMVIATQRPTIN